jgi:tRNA splicing ligase
LNLTNKKKQDYERVIKRIEGMQKKEVGIVIKDRYNHPFKSKHLILIV